MLIQQAVPTHQSANQQLNLALAHGIKLFLKREDLLHPEISGNKFRKLKYNLIAAHEQQYNTLLTFGGAYSNHIAAVAAAGREFGFNTIGIIRGEELATNYADNHTLNTAQANGMQLHFISRAAYRHKNAPDFIAQLREQFGDFFLIPEGGTNQLAIQGCEEILTEQDKQYFDYIGCAVGTGGTIAGIINTAAPHQQVLGFPALKGDFLQQDIQPWTTRQNWQLMPDYHFGGYAKITPELMGFVAQFEQDTGIEIEPIYTGKMLFGILDLIAKGFFPANSKILAIHTGGLQGKASMKAKIK